MVSLPYHGISAGRFSGRGIGSGGRPSSFHEIAAAFVVPENTGLQFCDRHVLAEVPAVVAVHHDSVRILFQNFGGSAQILQFEGVGVLVEPDASACQLRPVFPYNHPRYTVADFFGVLPSYFV